MRSTNPTAEAFHTRIKPFLPVHHNALDYTSMTSAERWIISVMRTGKTEDTEGLNLFSDGHKPRSLTENANECARSRPYALTQGAIINTGKHPSCTPILPPPTPTITPFPKI